MQLLIVDGEADQKSTRGVDFPTNGYVPLSQTGAELLFDIFSQRYERGAVFGSERLTGALLDRLTHHVHILEMNGESYRLKTSSAHKRRHAGQPTETGETIDPETGEILNA